MLTYVSQYITQLWWHNIIILRIQKSVYFNPSIGVEVGIEEVNFGVRESFGSIEICAAIMTPGDCTVAFPFSLIFNTSDESAGVQNQIHVLNVYFIC